MLKYCGRTGRCPLGHNRLIGVGLCRILYPMRRCSTRRRVVLALAGIAVAAGCQPTPRPLATMPAVRLESSAAPGTLLETTPATQPAGRLGLLGAIRGSVEGEFRNLFDRATLEVREGAEEAAGRVSQLAADVGYYAAREAMRNAAKYGRGGRQERPLHLSVEVAARGNELEITIEDDGVGLDPNRASEGGSGQGLALHSTMMAVVGGSLAVESSPGAFTRVVLTLPARG